MKINVLSLFDGVATARAAIESLGFEVDRYFASEVNLPAIRVAGRVYPDIFHIGDVRKISGDEKQEIPQYIFVEENEGVITSHYTGGIDLLIGGSPCQDLSIAKGKDRKGLDGEKSSLFWEYARLLREVKPKWFLLENVASMPKEAKRIITETLGVEPIMIDAALVSGQTRKRLFWTNIPNVYQPIDRGIILKDILEPVVDEKYYVSEKTLKNMRSWGNPQSGRIRSVFGKSVTLQAGGGGAGAKTGLYAIVTLPRGKNTGSVSTKKTPTLTTSNFSHNNPIWEMIDNGEVRVRRLTPVECERLQGLSDGHTAGESDTERYRMCGNGFNKDVIAHILSFIQKQYEQCINPQLHIRRGESECNGSCQLYVTEDTEL